MIYVSLPLFVSLLFTIVISADDAIGNQFLPSNRKFVSITWNSVLLIPDDLALVTGFKILLVR